MEKGCFFVEEERILAKTAKILAWALSALYTKSK